jgi:hypothetical protein
MASRLAVTSPPASWRPGAHCSHKHVPANLPMIRRPPGIPGQGHGFRGQGHGIRG